jgi:NADH:ubiquinone oxidoreductase subunit 5 (subunit L)/multisubunit Na+/H+ antiporter MnhA subunit
VAAVFHIINHATFKASLFMAAGIIDHEPARATCAACRPVPAMPITGTLAMVASAAMAGVPLLNGFLSKEMFFAETRQGPVPGPSGQRAAASLAASARAWRTARCSATCCCWC